MVLTGQRVCLVLRLLVKSQGRVGFQVWSQENTPQMPTYLQYDIGLGCTLLTAAAI